MSSTQLELAAAVTTRIVDGIEMGVLKDGTAYLTGRSLARLCGVAISTIIERKDEWVAGQRQGKFGKLLASTGYDEQTIAFPVKHTAAGVGADALAYPEPVVMAFLEYYTFVVPKPEAVANYRILGRAGFRLFVYNALGFDPSNLVPASWREFHDRLALHSTPAGYFSVFKEMSDFVLAGIRAGFKVDHKTVPDISVGQMWAKHWTTNELESKYGARQKHDHNYPDYFPQSDSNPQPMNVYPLDALGEFRKWLQGVYIPEKFPTYLAGKIKQGVITASRAELLLTEVQPNESKALPAKP